ncbi:spore coat U domain-containing protein [uncultured Oxalicibacterium sp.]|uniref:Csu type fimbrial protein n=1 Tax=uncultured Oxalicibacterium sp. TaxID=1168540 RepID=UPI0025CD44AF|nr:spore coat U domain-containing protein [uncultured Oxalicibacterium sp.]
MSNMLKAAVLCSAALASGMSWSATANNTFQVTATVISSCTVSGTTLNFGNSIDPFSATTPLDSTSTLTVACTNTTPYTVALNAGTHAGGATNFSARAIQNGSSTLGYQLYSDSNRSTVWGNGSNSSGQVSGTGSGSNQSLTIYGRLPSLTGAVPGSYTDTVTVTITY